MLTKLLKTAIGWGEILAIATVAAALNSCLKIDVPAHYTYSLQPSDDLLELFTINVQYCNHKGEVISERVTDNDWNCLIYQIGASSPDGVNVKLSAKASALDGRFPDKETFDFRLNPQVTFTPDGRQNVITTKSSGEEVTTFSFKVPAGLSDPEGITISICPLKYDKHFAFSYSVDDSYENGWSKIFALFNGLWIDDQEFFHFGLAPSTGTQAAPLCVTDGCGNDRRFTFGESIQPCVWNKNNPEGIIQDVITSKYNPYISWEELQMMTDLGNAVYWHNVNSSKWFENDPEEISLGFAEDFDRTMSKIGYPLKTLAQPDGNVFYLQAARSSDLVCLTRVTGNIYTDICLDRNPSLFKEEIFGGNSAASNEEKLEELASQARQEHPILTSKFTHRPQEDELSFFREVAQLYGKDGADNIWVASYDEIYDYTFLKGNAVISAHIQDGHIVFDVTVPSDAKCLFNELSFIVSGADGKAEPCSENLCGFSSVRREDGTVLVNCNFGRRTFEMAEKYVSLYESTRNEYHKNFASYLTSLLREDLRVPLLERIDEVHEPTREEMPLEGEYRRALLPDYIRLYDGYSFVLK